MPHFITKRNRKCVCLALDGRAHTVLRQSPSSIHGGKGWDAGKQEDRELENVGSRKKEGKRKLRYA